MHDAAFETYRCELLVRELVFRADIGDRASVADLFVADGTYSFGPNNLQLNGREAIRAWFAETSGPNRPLARHICTNTTVRFHDPFHAHAPTYLTLVRLATSPPQLPAPLKGIQGVGVYEDELVKIGDYWLFETREYKPTFSLNVPS